MAMYHSDLTTPFNYYCDLIPEFLGVFGAPTIPHLDFDRVFGQVPKYGLTMGTVISKNAIKLGKTWLNKVMI